jgi:hypothetical protein
MNKFALVDLKGGLGNQIFQVSFANYLKSQDINSFLDTTFFHSNHQFPRDLEIDPKELGFIKLRIKSNTIFELNKSIFWEDDTFRINDLKMFNRFVGYYQNIKYLEFSKPFLQKKLKLESNNLKVNKVAVHIRKTDYGIINQELSDNYYQSAISELLDIKSNLKLDIFTDDKNLKLNNSVFKNIGEIYKPNSSISSLDVMREMLNYKYFITANSSFSCIAAYLSNFQDKVVFYPKPWFKNSEIAIKNIPKHWKSIANN